MLGDALQGPEMDRDDFRRLRLIEEENQRLRMALEPFVRAAEIIVKRPQDYQNRIVAIGGLSEPRDLMKIDFERARLALLR